MKRFLTRTLIFLAPPLIGLASVFYLADGRTDNFYLRFTTPKQTCFLLGTSRAAQGMQPAEIDKGLRSIYPDVKMFNYSFTIVQSPYGPTYYYAIQKKIDPKTKRGVFILAVDPWAISSLTKDPNDSANFKEKELCLGKLTDVTSNPNIPYLLSIYDEPLLHILKSRLRPNPGLLHKDGWLEINAPMDSVSVKKRLAAKIETYKKTMMPVYHFSSVRFYFLQKMISFLQQHGDVYLVRLPISPQIKLMEAELMPDFDAKINSLAAQMKIPYFNFIGSCADFSYTDGNHLYKKSGKQVSQQIADSIVTYKAKGN